MGLTGSVFLTGGTGSLGQALLRRAEAEGWDCRFTVYSRDEVKQGEVKARFPRHRYVLGDVQDEGMLRRAMAGADLVIHAAAYKQVPAAEVNAEAAVKVNVLGSANVARVAVSLGIPKVLGISTDKSCAPVNAYGQTKALMERLFQEATTWGRTEFLLCRYGNVLGSRGSVVPLFRRQAAESSRITVTDPTMTRFWLTLGQAVDLLLTTLSVAMPGCVLIPKCPASSMATLAAAVAPDAEIVAIGARPGEKQHEQLVNASESMHASDLGRVNWQQHLAWPGPGYFVIYPAFAGITGNLPAGFEYRSDTARQLSVEELRALLREGEA